MVRASSFNTIHPCHVPHSHGSPPSAPLPPSTLRLAPLAVGAPVPLPRRRRGLRPPPASASPLLRCPHHRARLYPRLRSLALPPHFLPQHGGMVRAPSFNTIHPCYIPHPHGSPPSTLCLAPLAVGTAVPHPRRRCGLRPPPASASPPAPVSTARALYPRLRSLALPLHFPSPTRRHGPCPILQHHPSLLHPPPSRLAALNPLPRSARRRHRRPASASPVRASPASGFRIPPAPVSTARASTHASGRSRSLYTFLPQHGGMVRAPSFNTIHPCYIPPPSRLAALNPLPRSARRRHRRPASASPARASPASGFRIPPCPGVRTTAVASGSVLRTTARSSFGSAPHSVAVAAPFRRSRRRRSPLAFTLGFIVPDRVPRLWFSHPTHPRCWLCHWRLWRVAFCATVAFRCRSLVGPSVCRTDTRRPSCPWPYKATLVLHRYTEDTRLSLPKTQTDTQPPCAHHGGPSARGCICARPHTRPI